MDKLSQLLKKQVVKSADIVITKSKLNKRTCFFISYLRVFSKHKFKSQLLLKTNKIKKKSSRIYHMKSPDKIVDNCVELKHIDFSFNTFDEDSMNYFVNNLTTKIEKVALTFQSYLYDKYVEHLVKRCNKIKWLILVNTPITNKCLMSIIRELKVIFLVELKLIFNNL